MNRSVFRSRFAPRQEEERSNTTLIVVIVIIIVLLVIGGILVWWFFFRSSSASGCTTTADCVGNEVCVNGTCTPSSGGCTVDADCQSGEVCVNGSCITQSGCQTDGDCPQGMECDGGTCVPIGCTVPNAPTGVALSSLSTGTLTVTWNPVGDATSYNIYLGIVSGFTRAQAVQSPTTTNTSFQFSGLTTPTAYYILVSASNACGESVNSAESMIFLSFVWPAQFVVRNCDPAQGGCSPTLNAMTASASGQTLFPTGSCENCTAALPCGTACYWNHDQNSNEIRMRDNPSLCWVADAAAVDEEIKLQPCAGASPALKQWFHDPSGPKICLTQHPTLCVSGEADFFGNQAKLREFGLPVTLLPHVWQWYPDPIAG